MKKDLTCKATNRILASAHDLTPYVNADLCFTDKVKLPKLDTGGVSNKL